MELTGVRNAAVLGGHAPVLRPETEVWRQFVQVPQSPQFDEHVCVNRSNTVRPIIAHEVSSMAATAPFRP